MMRAQAGGGPYHRERRGQMALEAFGGFVMFNEELSCRKRNLKYS
jgi:hypothetical protein